MRSILRSFLFGTFYLVTLIANAQVGEGILQAKITATFSDPSQQEMMEMMGWTEVTNTIYFKMGKTRLEQSIFSITNTFIYDSNIKQGIILMDPPIEMGDKTYASFDESLINEEARPELTVENTGETTKILGYDCKKYIVRDPNNDNVHTTVWTTEDIYIRTKDELFENIKGTPLKWVQTEKTEAGSEHTNTMTYEVIEIKITSVSDDKFDMTIPEGYIENPELLKQ